MRQEHLVDAADAARPEDRGRSAGGPRRGRRWPRRRRAASGRPGVSITVQPPWPTARKVQRSSSAGRRTAAAEQADAEPAQARRRAPSATRRRKGRCVSAAEQADVEDATATRSARRRRRSGRPAAGRPGRPATRTPARLPVDARAPAGRRAAARWPPAGSSRKPAKRATEVSSTSGGPSRTPAGETM